MYQVSVSPTNSVILSTRGSSLAGSILTTRIESVNVRKPVAQQALATAVRQPTRGKMPVKQDDCRPASLHAVLGGAVRHHDVSPWAGLSAGWHDRLFNEPSPAWRWPSGTRRGLPARLQPGQAAAN